MESNYVLQFIFISSYILIFFCFELIIMQILLRIDYSS